jgi:hypothetical protein
MQLSNLSSDKINLYYSEFYKSYVFDDKIDSCYFRLGQYVFDKTSLITIPKGNKLRLYIRNDIDGTITDTTTTKKYFFKLWVGALDKWTNRKIKRVF